MAMNSPIYFDYAATTPLDRRVAEKMYACLVDGSFFGNPASQHYYGLKAKDAVQEAREQVAATINAEAREIIWTSGATESNNLAIKGVVQLYKRKGKHIVTLKTEHKAVLDTCQYLEKNGFQLTYLTPQTNGLIDAAALEAALRHDTILVSVMAVNNETGVIQDIAKLAQITSSRGIFFHVDAAQASGKISIDVTRMPIDLLALSAHKAYGPKGIGALYLRKKPRVRVEALQHGGGHEQGMRSGTLPTHQIVGMGEALSIAEAEREQDIQRISKLRLRFWQGIQKIKCLKLNMNFENTAPQFLNLQFGGMLADAILNDLPEIAASTASACQGKGTEGSYVLRALGLSEAEIKSSVRFSFGRFTTSTEIDVAIIALLKLFKLHH